MIQYRKIDGNSGYCWLDRRHTDSEAFLDHYIREDDPPAVAAIPNHERASVSLLGRAMLHYLVGCMMGTIDYTLDKSVSGRPGIYDRAGRQIAHASVSHSHEVVAAAISMHAAIGIDVEYCSMERDYRPIAQRVFTASVTELIQSPADFYRAWCLYEAWGKANDLQYIDPGKNAALMRLLENSLSGTNNRAYQGGSILLFSPAEDYSGCVFYADEQTGDIHALEDIAL